MAKIRYSAAAMQDLEEIGDYILEELKSPEAALNTVNRIQDTIEKLVDFPQIGISLSTRYEDVGNYHFVVCGSYLAFYHERMNDIYIDRILYGKRDYMNILFGGVLENDTEQGK